ncbi:uncharacterized protein LOC131320585 isoform X1 [Rhododendron vialii]|uniref:uncharacterized protein LOC131320585 isoform X1 n=1 Tax=Rhododendron vialii TaxID=182163 RepID=UPI00265DEB05|nr:uncharacterized protein LOC131320585 isoform X1 [Rhododendron vialii]
MERAECQIELSTRKNWVRDLMHHLCEVGRKRRWKGTRNRNQLSNDTAKLENMTAWQSSIFQVFFFSSVSLSVFILRVFMNENKKFKPIHHFHNIQFSRHLFGVTWKRNASRKIDLSQKQFAKQLSVFDNDKRENRNVQKSSTLVLVRCLFQHYLVRAHPAIGKFSYAG